MSEGMERTVAWLLEVDGMNADMTAGMFGKFDPALVRSYDDAVGLYDALAVAFSQSASDDADIEIFNAVGVKLGCMSGEDFQSILDAPPPQNPDAAQAVARAQLAQHRVWARRARGILLSFLFRKFMYAATDVRRLRIVEALGHLRPQAEAAGLMKVMLEAPEVAKEWFSLRTDQEGRRFFRAYQSRIEDLMRESQLIGAWNAASGSAQHVRLASVARALQFAESREGTRIAHQVKLDLQDMDNDAPEEVILNAIYVFEVQARLYQVLGALLPEVGAREGVWAQRGAFRRQVTALWARLERSYPEKVALWKHRGDETAGAGK